MQPSRFLILTNACTIIALIGVVATGRLPLQQVWIVAPVSLAAINLAAFWGLRARTKRQR